MHEESSGELALGGPEDQYALLMECVTDYAIFLMDSEGRVAAWNAGAERIFGYTEEEALGLPFERFFTPEDVERGLPEKELRTAVTQGRATDDKWHLRKDGTRFWVSGITTALRDDDGGLRGFAKVTRDRTERRQAEDVLREANRRKDEFLAVLAHELRGPLAPVRNVVQVLQLRGQADPDLQWSSGVIDRQVRHLTRLVDDLLDMARIRQGKLTLAKERVELTKVVAHAVETCGPLIEARKHQFDVLLPSEPVWLEADPIRLAQVLGNLLANAAKYTPEGGRITLTAERNGGGELILRVKDNGIGISTEMLHRVFDLFTQVEPSHYHSQGGLGIGLTLVKNLVELHGGSVTAQSEGYGKGSEFRVHLPTLPAPPLSSEEGAKKETAQPSPSRRVLVVDDNVDAAQSLALVLRHVGHEVQTVHESAAVLETARTFAPDVVLLDIGLPGAVSGYDLAPQLRQIAGLEKVLLVALTGYGQEEDKRRSQEAQFDVHLVKPADLEALYALLAQGPNRR
jgi:PAS domain S-box-containing protein